jgi:glycosyltransferase involved in cell wall biosynthesis
VGVLQPRKNVAGLVAAYRLLPPELQASHRLVITGKPGWMTGGLATLAQELGEAVKLTGYVPDEDLPVLYSMADCLAYPSLYEGFGLPPLEAMACGTPVVTSNVASLPEVCGDAALLVDPSSVTEISAALQRVLTDAALRTQMIERGRDQAARFDWTTSARRLLSVLRGVVR